MTGAATFRPATTADAPAMAETYAHCVLSAVVTFETVPPDCEEIAARVRGVLDGGYPGIGALRRKCRGGRLCLCPAVPHPRRLRAVVRGRYLPAPRLAPAGDRLEPPVRTCSPVRGLGPQADVRAERRGEAVRF